MIDLPSPTFTARFKPKAAPEPIKRRPLPAMPRWFGAYLRTLNVGWKFTVASCAEKTGRTPEAVRVCIWHALKRELVTRKVWNPGRTQTIWRRTVARVDASSVNQKGIEIVEKMPAGREFTHRDLTSRLSNSTAHRVIRQSQIHGLIDDAGLAKRPETTYKKVKNET